MKTSMTFRVFALWAVLVAFFVAGCGKKSTNSPGDEYNPIINPDNFVAEINNQYLPYVPGTTFIYVGVRDSLADSNVVYVTHETRDIMGVSCIVVRDQDYRAGDLAEQTYDWYAQDNEGNVWYFGEIALEYQNGYVISTEGSWEAGVDGAKPGIVMEGNLHIGDTYRQEYLPDVAEDMAKVLSVTDSLTVPYGTYTDCLKTKEWTPLQPGVVENKYYARNVGLLKAVMVEGGTEYTALVAIQHD